VHYPIILCFSCPRLAYLEPVVWAEARRNCQQEGATMAVVNSKDEAEILRYVYFKYGPAKIQLGRWGEIAEELPDATRDEPTDELPTPEPVDGIVHIGFHDIFIEGEYLTVCSK
jgi:hypothetical protein